MSEPDHIVEARRWLQFSQEDLQAAELILQHPTIAHRHVCWLSQQCAEKAIKAALIFLKIDFRRTHDLDMLLKLLPTDWELRREFADLAELTQWAVESRYPGDWQPANEHDANLAFEQARDVLEKILSALENYKIMDIKIKNVIQSPRFSHPEQASDFEMEIDVDDKSTE